MSLATCTPNPRVHTDAMVRTRDIDFARAFEEDPQPRESGFAIEQIGGPRPARYPPFRVPMRPVRVMLSRSVREAAFNANGVAHFRAAGTRETFSGRMTVTASSNAGHVAATIGRERREFRLPCTLFVSNPNESLALGDKTYRGQLVIVAEGSMLSVINSIDMEDYIRGVVPLEIGNLREAEIEAVKAQAIAARTYAYKRMIANEERTFDVVATVADQVYGGANAEGEVADRAILLTKNLIMAYGDEIVQAFYHSTCGGKTAAIEDVWGGDTIPYLRSIRDVDERGAAYCSESRVFTWTETWSVTQLSEFVRQYSTDGNLRPPFSGTIRGLQVRERFACGRAKTLVVTGANRREHTTGGDKLRWLLRRGNSSRSILRSSDIREITKSGSQVTISGGGFGHGIGMCQTGAIGRARAGQTYEQILRAYYSGMLIRTATDRGR